MDYQTTRPINKSRQTNRQNTYIEKTLRITTTIVLQAMTLATQRQNPFTQREIKLKNIITPNRYQSQYLNQYSSLENGKLQQTAPKITNFFNKTKIQPTSNSQKVNHIILKMKITSTKINNSTLISHKKIVGTRNSLSTRYL